MPLVGWERARHKGKPPKPKVDVDVLRIAESVLKKRLGDYKTTLEVCEFTLSVNFLRQLHCNSQDDEALLDVRQEVSCIKYRATVVRVGEKRILKGAIGEIMRKLANEGRDNKKRPMDSDEMRKLSKKNKRQ